MESDIHTMYKKPFVKYKPRVENISEYSTYKVLAHLTKPRSGISIKFVSNDEDGWTIDKLSYKTKTGEITLNEGINADSYPDFMRLYIEKGYKQI